MKGGEKIMATTTKLALTFNIGSNKTSVINYNYAKPSVTEAQVQALASGIVTNGSIFKKVPLSVKSAKLITTDTTEFDVE